MKLSEIIKHPDFKWGESKIRRKEWLIHHYVIPKFKDKFKYIYTIDEEDVGYTIDVNSPDWFLGDWSFYTEPKKTRKVKVVDYCYINSEGETCSVATFSLDTKRDLQHWKRVIGSEREIEVEE